VGDLGQWAYTFIDWLEAAGQTIWQVLPLGPTSYGDSPYQSLSTFAGNPLLISFDKLVAEGWLLAERCSQSPELPALLVDFGTSLPITIRWLAKAYTRFDATASAAQRSDFVAWCSQEAYWLDDWVLFIALKNFYGVSRGSNGLKVEALRDPAVLETSRVKLPAAYDEQKFRQWLFFKQWHELKAYANNKVSDW